MTHIKKPFFHNYGSTNTTPINPAGKNNDDPVEENLEEFFKENKPQPSRVANRTNNAKQNRSRSSSFFERFTNEVEKTLESLSQFLLEL